MADIRKLTDELYVAGQLTPADAAALDEHGFRAVLCNRPDEEETGQPDYQDIAQQTDALGLITDYQPVNGMQISEADVDDFAARVADLPRPLLAYCRTGTRCTILWALSQAGKRSTDEILAIAESAGYQLGGLADRLEARATKNS